MPPTARRLRLARHPEGGWYRETWRSDVETRLPDGRTRVSGTAIYFLLAPGEESARHVVASSELWFWHAGGPLELRLGGSGARPGETPETVVLGPDLAEGQEPQAVVPAGVWQAARPALEREALVSCVVSPGFDFADFQMFSE